MVRFWLVRPEITNWPIDLLGRHFGAGWPWTEGGLFGIGLRSY